MRKNKFYFSIISLFILFYFQKVNAGPEANVFGWAWAGGHQINNNPLAAIGWISFNNCMSAGECSGVNYGVKISPNGYFSGYAWSGGGENRGVLGWISFNRNETGAPPTADPCPSQANCIAKLEDGWQEKIGQENVFVKGWARIISVCPSLPCKTDDQNGGWDGWVRFDHGQSNYEVYIDQNGDFHGWAWANSPLGTISFNSSDLGGGGASYVVYLDLSTLNSPPSVDSLSSQVEYCNIFRGQALGRLRWQYLDPPPVPRPQKAYSIEVEQKEGSNWVQKISCYKIISDPVYPGTTSTFIFYINRDPSTENNCSLREKIDYNKRIRWRVMVFDQYDASSSWSSWQEVQLASHAYPWPSFNWSPQKPTVNQIVQFRDQSSCFDIGMNATSCSSWLWNFQDGNPSSSTIKNPTTTFTSIGTKNVTLRVSDADGYECTTSSQIGTTFPLPRWREFPPIIWWRKAIAFLSQMNLFK